MIVLKFGGTSVGSVESIRNMMQIVGSYPADQQLVVVVSAMSGVTNLLEAAGTTSTTNITEALGYIDQIEQKHYNAIEQLVAPEDKAELSQTIASICNEAKDICQGAHMLNEYSDKVRARLVSIGERLSSRLISKSFKAIGTENERVNSADFVMTDDNFVSAKVDMAVSTIKAKAVFANIDTLAIVPGFLATTASGEPTTLGRGGSDYTATLIGNFLDADKVDIWTDVDGVLTASPKLVSSAYSIPHLSYEEAMELSYFGAKVLYSVCVAPSMEKQIPIYVKNTFNPDYVGTIIGQSQEDSGTIVKGFSSIDDISLITISGSGMVGVPGIMARVFKAIGEAGINVLLVTQSSSEHTISIAVMKSDGAHAVSELDAEFSLEIERGKMHASVKEDDVSILAIVGDKMRETAGVSGKVFRQLGLNGVNVRAIAQGGTERNISVVVKTSEARKALNVLHDGFFLSKYRKVHLFAVGIGTVGGTMLKQLREQADYLKEEYSVDFRLVGVANSRKMLFDEKGLDLATYEEDLNSSGERMNLEAYVDRMKAFNLRNAIFIDNTASSEVAKAYKSVALNNVSVVASNKVMGASPMQELDDFRNVIRAKGLKFLNETNVGAGLPIIRTIEDLVATGDKVIKIQAVLSGSLNYIFNNIGENLSFSQAVVQAKEKGLTEPDPSIDLSGLDVMRKILILARVALYPIELEDVASNDIIPKEDQEAASFEELLVNLKRSDARIEAMRKEAAAEGKVLRYIAEFENGKASTRLQAVDSSHPAYFLDGMDNIVLIYTKRYNEQPLVVKGAGAGPEVTATGVFADVMRLANM